MDSINEDESLRWSPSHWKRCKGNPELRSVSEGRFNREKVEGNLRLKPCKPARRRNGVPPQRVASEDENKNA